MTAYTIALYIHIGSVILSGTFFLTRGIWMLQEHPLLQAKPVKVLPHIIDTILLVSAFCLAYLLNAYPFTDAWLTAKLIALVAYIALGMIALKRGKTKSIRTGAFIAALAAFGYIVAVAMSHSATLGI